MQKTTLFDAIIAIRRQKEKNYERQMRLRREFTRSSINKRRTQEPILPPVTTIY